MKVIDGCSSLYKEAFENLFTETELEVASVMLELSIPVVFSDDETPLTWGATKPRTNPLRQQQPPAKVPPEVGTSPSSCLSGEAVQTPPKTMKEDLGEVSSMYESLDRSRSNQRNIFPDLNNLSEEMEAFSIPVTHELISENQTLFREQGAAKPKRDKEESSYIDPTSSKPKY